MSMAAELSSGKGAADENFPVASHLVAARHRPLILAFYRVARLADDIADHAGAPPQQKLERLAEIESSLLGQGAAVPQAVALRALLDARGMSPLHMLDLLEAFRRDVTKLRYEDWDELMDYCRYSAAPVGRFVLDLHGEPRSTWPRSDALCAALQVINHLQDCGSDFLELDRVYLPRDALDGHDARVEMLGAAVADPALGAAIHGLAERTLGLLDAAEPFARQVKDLRLALEIGVIHRLARSLAGRLARLDPLAEKVRHRRWEALGLAVLGLGGTLATRIGSRQAGPAGP
ncbi:MAG TPA: squalene synthase HpnC [Caulobacteraceae bacterium]|nr:squalene synthase HpnC [Caulobacteraceae bacterium]